MDSRRLRRATHELFLKNGVPHQFQASQKNLRNNSMKNSKCVSWSLKYRCFGIGHYVKTIAVSTGCQYVLHVMSHMLYNREFGQKNKFDFGMSIFAFVVFCIAEYTWSFLLRFISVAQGYSPEHRAWLNEPLKCIVAKIKTHYKAKIFIPKSNLFFAQTL